MISLKMKFKAIAAMTIICLMSASLHAATLFENFESPGSIVKSFINGGAAVNYTSGQWHVFYNQMSSDDRYTGAGAVRMRGYNGGNYLQMKFDKAGAGTLSFKYGSYSNHRGGEFTVQKSTDGGATWSDLGTSPIIPTWNGTLLTYSIPVNYNGNIRFKIFAVLRTPNNANEQFNIDDFMVTDFGASQVVMPTSSVPTGVYDAPQTVTLSTSTPDATIYYTTDGSEPTTASNVYTSPLNIIQTTKIRMFAKATGAVDSREEVVIVNIPEHIATVAELAAKMQSSGTTLNYFKLTGEAVVSLGYTLTATSGNIGYAFLQDHTGGIALKDNFRRLSSAYNSGDKVTGLIAQVNNVNGIAQLYPAGDFTVVSTGNSLSPLLVSSIAEAITKPSQLVRINNVKFDGADGVKKFAANSSVFLSENDVVSNFPMRITSSLLVAPDFLGAVIPTSLVDIVGVVSRVETSFTDFSLFVRNANEINLKTTSIVDAKILKLTVNANIVSFESQTPETVTVYSVGGQKIKSFISVVGKNSFELSKGIYVIKVGNQVAKIVL